MPQPDPNLPESVVLGRFAGIKNTVAPERLTGAELEKAVNVDIDDAGQVRRRRGVTLVSSGAFHSPYTFGSYTYVVKNNALGIVYPNYSFTAIVTASSWPISYTPVGEQLYFSSFSHSGVLTGSTVAQWGAVVGGLWLSPVLDPTTTLGEISGKLLGNPPTHATSIEAYKGRIYMAVRNVIWATELYQYSYVDRTKNYMMLEHDITLMRSVGDGIYVGTVGGLYFLQGVFGQMSITQISPSPVYAGSAVMIPANLVHPQAKNGPVPTTDAVVLMTEAGICACFDGGTVFNLTQGQVLFPKATSAVALFRQQDGANTYVAVADSGGTPTANARIGDYVDAEIIRFQGG